MTQIMARHSDVRWRPKKRKNRNNYVTLHAVIKVAICIQRQVWYESDSPINYCLRKMIDESQISRLYVNSDGVTVILHFFEYL